MMTLLVEMLHDDPAGRNVNTRSGGVLVKPGITVSITICSLKGPKGDDLTRVSIPP